MKRNWIRWVAVMLLGALLGGAISPVYAGTGTGESGWTVKPLPPATENDSRLEAALQRELSPDLRSGQKVRYLYNRVDLNGDGAEEIFVLLLDTYYSGSGGSAALLFKPQSDGYELVSRFTLVRPPVGVSQQRSNGWCDLIMYIAGGGGRRGYARLQFDGAGYPSNPSVVPSVEASLDGAGMIVIGSDDRADRYFTAP